MAKAPAWEETSEIPAWDETEDISAPPKPPKSNLRDDVTFAGSEKAGKTASAFLPRTAKAAAEDKSYGNQAGSAGLDLLSLVGRALMTEKGRENARGNKIRQLLGKEEAPQSDFDWRESLADTQGKGFVDKVVRDPGMAAALMAVPFTAGLSSLPVYGRLAAQGAAAGAASAGAHQAENVIQGEGVKAGQAAGEIALNALIPMAGKALVGPMKSAGAKILHSVVKPEKAVLKAGYGRPGDPMHGSRAILEADRGGTLKSSLEQVENRLDELENAVEDAVLQKGRPTTITSPGAKPAPKPEFQGVNVTGGVVPDEDVIYASAGSRPALGGVKALPESTVPPAPAVVQAGAPASPALLGRTRETPSILVTPAPRPQPNVADVLLTPNRTAMPNQIDPRFVRPTATRTSNQPPIPDAPEGVAYGSPSGRNLPATLGNRQVQGTTQGMQEAAEDLAEAIGAAPEDVLRYIKAPKAKPAAGSQASPGRALPGGTPEPQGTTQDITKVINLLKSLERTKGSLGREVADFEHAGLADDIGAGVKEWASDLAERSGGEGATLMQALKYQRGVGKFGKFNYGQNPQLIPAKSRVANEYYSEIGDDLQAAVPEIGPLRREQSELIPQRMALMAALARTDKNFAAGLKEAIAAASAMAGAASAGPAGALPGLSLAGGLHASQSPRVASGLYKAGKSLDRESATRDAIKRLLLQVGFSEPQEP